jgi:antitoxin HicB
MHMTRYPVILKPHTNGTVLVTFPDVPEAVTFGTDEADALGHAVSALESALMFYIADRRPVPRPSKIRRKRWAVAVSLLAEAKIALSEAMIVRRVRKAELARRLGIHMPQVDRLLDLSHSSKIEQLEAALNAVGKYISIEVRDAA